MNKHSGLRPQDIVVLLKIACKGNLPWYSKDLAQELYISASEISESLNRCVEARLLDTDKRTLMKMSLLEFLKYGIKYCYAEHPGTLVRGVPTAHSARPLSNLIQGHENYVWPSGEGTVRGLSVRPLYPTAPKACLKDAKLHELLALTDAIRLGRVREQNLAIKELEKRLR